MQTGTLVQNLDRAIMKKTVIKMSGNEVMSVDDSDVLNCTAISGRRSWRGKMTNTKASIRLVTETQRGFASMPETKMRQSRPTRPSPMPSATASTSRSISSCSRATCRSTKARLETGWSTNSNEPSTTTAAQFGPQTMPTRHMTLKTSV